MDMLNAEKTISITQYLGSADSCDEPDIVGRAAARRCGEEIVEELLARGYPKTAIVNGIKDALSAITDTPNG